MCAARPASSWRVVATQPVPIVQSRLIVSFLLLKTLGDAGADTRRRVTTIG